jgi:hypothetical protein
MRNAPWKCYRQRFDVPKDSTMTLKHRLDRLQRKTPTFYADISEVPTHELERLVRKAFREGNFTQEEAELCRRLEERGFEF